MARKAKSKPRGRKNARKKNRSWPLADLDWARLRSAAVPIGLVVAVLAVSVSAVIGVRTVRDRAAEIMLVSASGDGDRSSDRVTPRIEIRWPPIDPADPSQGTWLPDEDQAELLALAERAAAVRDPLSRRPLSAIGRALAGTGWLRGVPSVRRLGSGEIVVEGEWRIPLAVVRDDGRDYLVSVEGVPMPPIYRAGTSGQKYVIGASGVPSASGPARYSQPWPEERVLAGLELLRALIEEPFAGEVAGVDVSRLALADGQPGSGMIEIITVDGSRVVWGSPMGVFRAGEQADTVKLSRLADLFSRYGRIDGGIARLEIYGPVVEIDRRTP